GTEGNQCQASADREDVHRQSGSQRASVVQTPDLRTRRLHGIRREDNSRSPRGNGRKQMAGRRSGRSPGRPGADERGQPRGLHRTAVGAGGRTTASYTAGEATAHARDAAETAGWKITAFARRQSALDL